MSFIENVSGPFKDPKAEYDAVINYTRTFHSVKEDSLALALSMRFFSPKIEFYRQLSNASDHSAISSPCSSTLEFDLGKIRDFINSQLDQW